MEYLKKDCINKDGKLCDFCQPHAWVGPSQEIIPQPVPDPNNLGHYMKHFETLTSRRFPVFGQPRKKSLVMEICRQRQTLNALPPIN